MLATKVPGVLTVATGQHPSPPWFTGQDPATSDGYEASVARDVALVLGYEPKQVAWTIVDTQQALDGSTGGFDIFVDQVRQPENGSDVLDFSTGYYAITDSLLVSKATVGAPEGILSDFTNKRLGVVSGGTGQSAVMQRGGIPTTFESSVAGVAALTAGSVDGLVLPTPDALAIVRGLATVAVVGQLPPGQWQPDQFHLVLAKDSPLTACVTAAVDRLRIEGTLESLTQQWITGPLAPLLH